MAPPPASPPPRGRGPSPRDEATRTGRGGSADRRGRGWDETDAPWLEEGDEQGEVHTLVGRRALWAMLFGLAVLTVGVIVGIMLVSKGDSSPIDVPAVGEEVPVLASPGPWKVAPTGADIDGIPIEGQGQILFGTGDGRDSEARIALEALPEDPMPRPGSEMAGSGTAGTELEAEAMASAEPPAAPPAAAPPPPAIAPTKPAPKLAVPKTIYPPTNEPTPPETDGQVLQLGAFSSEARARAAFKSLSERFGYLDGLEPRIQPVAKDGQTLYRLRTSAGSAAQARDICGRLRIAGESCSLVD